MAVSGLEQVLRGFSGRRSFMPALSYVSSEITSQAHCISNPRLREQDRRENRDDWEEWWAFDGMGEFMNVTDGRIRTLFEDWLHGETNLASMTDVLSVAYAMRCATVHGALSATKVLQWELEEPICQLSEAIVLFTCEVAEHISSEMHSCAS